MKEEKKRRPKIFDDDREREGERRERGCASDTAVEQVRLSKEQR